MIIEPIPLALAILLSLHGLRKKSLSPSGSLTAFIVGYGSLSGGLWAFGVTLIGFYLTGSRATKYGKQRKAKLEDGYHEAGYRTGWQVLCNSATGVITAVLWNALFVPNSLQARTLSGIARRMMSVESGMVYSEMEWCPLDRKIAGGWSRALVLAALGHYACCLGDTLASELGILSQGRPRLITTLKPVPPGTNGGMSIGGTLASIGGGAVVGILTGICLMLESIKCREGWSTVLVETVCIGAACGFFGSLVDSILGATVQETRYSEKKQVVLQDSSSGVVISGWNILTNNQVNYISSLCTSVVAGVL